MSFLVATNIVVRWPPKRRATKTPHALAKRKRMLFIVATNVVAIRPPERRPTGTPHVHANFCLVFMPRLITPHGSWD